MTLRRIMALALCLAADAAQGNPPPLVAVDSLVVDVLSDDVSDPYVSKTSFATSELANVVAAGATVVSGETLCIANLGYGLRLRTRVADTEHVLLFDVAVAVNDWCRADYAEPGAGVDAHQAGELLEAYAGVRPFSETERLAWPVMLRAAALRFWVSRLYDFHLPRPGELVNAHDPSHFRDLLAWHVAASGRVALPGAVA
jgi:hypothetical protein